MLFNPSFIFTAQGDTFIIEEVAAIAAQDNPGDSQLGSGGGGRG
jgi:hypothetical protein